MTTRPPEEHPAARLHEEARALRREGALPEALDKLHRALALCREFPHPQAEGTILTHLGAIYHDLGEAEQALEHYRQGLAIFREVHDREGEGSALAGLGRVHKESGELLEAVEHYEQALPIYRELRDRETEAILAHLGEVLYRLGRFQEAIEHYRQALTIAREVGDRRGEEVLLRNLDALHERLGRTEEAPGKGPMRQISAVHLNAICRLVCKRMGDVYTGPSALLIEGGKQVLVVPGEKGTYRAKGTEDGIAVFNEDGELLAQIEGATIDQPLPAERGTGIPEEDLKDLAESSAADELDRAIALRQEGQNLFLAQSRPGDALPLYDEALEIFRRLGDRRRERTTLHDKGLVQGALGQPQEALASLRQALAVGQEIQEAAGEGTIVNNIAAVYHGMGQLEEAIRYYKEALAIHRRLGDRANEQIALNNLAEALEALGRNDEATRCREEAASLLGEESGEPLEAEGEGGVQNDGG